MWIEIFIITLAIIFLSVFTFIFINTLFVFIYLYVDHTLGCMQHKPGYQPVSNLRYIKNFWLELFYVLGKFYLWPFKFFNFTLNKKQHPTAILLVHGYCRNLTDWLWFIFQLRKLNCPVYLINLNPSLAPIEYITANSLPKKIEQIKRETECKKIILIGHSMGGIVSSYYSEFLDEENIISAVISIGSGYSGTKISVAGAGPNALQMCPNTKFLVNLKDQIAGSSKEYYQVASQFDNLIYPWTSALLEGTPENQQYILPTVGHITMLHSRPVAKKVTEWVADLLKH